MGMMVASLASGSSGNSYYIQCVEGAILVDAGLSGKRVIENIRAAGGDPALIKGVVVTHDHSDHASGAGILQRQHGWRLWMTAGTESAAASRMGKFKAEIIRPGTSIQAAGMEISFHATPHDGVEPVMVSIARNGARCGIFTDLGHVYDGLRGCLEELDFLFLESNYDPEMLAANRRYPHPLKARIRGDHGHLSNREAAELITSLRECRLKRVALSHLSQENNKPDLAKSCFTKIAGEYIRETGLKVGVSPRHTPMQLCPVL